MSEPWNTEDDFRDEKQIDTSAKVILFAGLTLSLASIVVGSIVRPVLDRIRPRANKEKL